MLSSNPVESALTQVIREKFAALGALLNERTRRRWAAVEARALGRGGIARVAEATGLSRTTIAAGLRELAEGREDEDASGRLRNPGAGRKSLPVHDAGLVVALEKLVDPATRGDPMGPLRWTCSSAALLARELQAAGQQVSERSVNRLLHELGYSLQANRKTLEGRQHPDRDAQFNHINRQVKAFQRQRQPVVSVDTKKKELVGPFKNAGREWRPRGDPERVRVHDFPDSALGKAIPYGVYDLTRDAGWVSVGVDHDTAAFAVETLRRWWWRMGCVSYPAARRLLITADGGGSNGSRNRLWKWELQKLSDETGLRISVCHFPPGTSKWNKIEHRMFCHITENWRGRPLVSLEVVVNLIGHTTTRSGLAIRSELDANNYPTGQPVTAQQMESISLKRDKFHGDWNYSRLCLPGRSEKIREVVCRFGAHVPIRAVWLARAADWAVRRRPGARVTRGTSASSNRTARSAGCVVNWRAPPATGTDGSVAANASRSNSTRRGGPAADRQPPLPRTGRKVAAGIPDGGLAHATVGRAAARARDRSTRPSRRRCRRRVRTAAARLT